MTARSRVLFTAIAIACAAGAAPALARSSAAGTPSGAAVARSSFVQYADSDVFVEGGTIGPADAGSSVSTASVDGTANGKALAALGYSGYEEIPGAANSLGAPLQLPYGDAHAGARAAVQGPRPASQDTSLPATTPVSETGIVHAELAEGLTALARATGTRVANPDGEARSGDSTAVVNTANATAATVASAVVRDVHIGVVTFASVTVSASATADGRSGTGDAQVVVEGVTLAGLPVEVVPGGVVAATNEAPIDTTALHTLLLPYGVELVGIGTATSERSANRVVSIATGPRLRYRDATGRDVQEVLGQAIASSTLLPALRVPSFVSSEPFAVFDATADPELVPVLSGSVSNATDQSARAAPSEPPSASYAGRTRGRVAASRFDLDRLVLFRHHVPGGVVVLYGFIAVAALLVTMSVAAPFGGWRARRGARS